MRLDELKESISKILSRPNSVQIYFIIREDKDFTIKLADIENIKTAPALKKLFQDYLEQEIVNNQDLSLCNLSSADERANALYEYDYEEYPEELGIFREFDILNAVNSDKFSFKDDHLSKLHGYLIYLGSMEQGMVLFKKHYPISLIKRDSFLLEYVKSNNRFKKFDGSEIIRLNGSAQLIKLNEKIYITDLKVLERNFGFDKLIHRAAEEAIKLVQELEILEDIEVLKDAVDDLSFARRLSKVKNTSPILTLNIPIKEVLEFTKNTPVLTGKFKYNDDGSKIRLDTKKSKEAFLKLLNDAFLHSELTKLYYDAKAKDKIIQE